MKPLGDFGKAIIAFAVLEAIALTAFVCVMLWK